MWYDCLQVKCDETSKMDYSLFCYMQVLNKVS